MRPRLGEALPSPAVSAFAQASGDQARRLDALGVGVGVGLVMLSALARLEPLMVYYGVLDRAPMGRNEGQSPEPWFRRHDEYAAAG